MKSAKEIAAIVLAKRVLRKSKRDALNAVEIQKKCLAELIKKGSQTHFGRDHMLQAGMSYEDFKKAVPIRDYEELRPYFERAKEAEPNVLWPGIPLYISKTSGTTSGTKYIPITPESMPFHIKAARNALLLYIATGGHSSFVNHKMIFLQGSPILNQTGKVPSGRLSGIVANYVPVYLQRNRLPSWETNCIEDWEEKVDRIVDETINQDMGLISGIPSWVQMYYEKLIKKSGKKVGDLFPHFRLFVYGGVNFEPYRKKFRDLVGREVDVIQTYPASEGFIAFQDRKDARDMLLNTDGGMFFEFIEPEYLTSDLSRRKAIWEVELGVNYAVILSSNAGLWAYNIGDTVKFTSLKPYRITVSGRVKHFTSAFGEHVIAEEVERAMQEALLSSDALVSEFTLAPNISPGDGLPYHEWFIEFEKMPSNPEKFVSELDLSMRKQNIYYKDLITGNVLRPLVISCVATGAFMQYMQSIGKLGGQNKIPRLQNNRSIADALAPFVEKQII